MGDLTDVDYTQTKNFKDFKIKSFDEYTDLYVLSDTLLVVNVFDNF